MYSFDTKELNNITFHDITDYGKTTTFVTIDDSCLPVMLYLDLYMYSGFIKEKDRYLKIASIHTRIYHDELEIIDFFSTYENSGNGKQLFLNMLKCVDIINKQMEITKITGEISPVDFSHWDKLVHLYSNMKYYILKYHIDLSYYIEFSLNGGLPIDELIANMSLYKSNLIGFHYKIIQKLQ